MCFYDFRSCINWQCPSSKPLPLTQEVEEAPGSNTVPSGATGTILDLLGEGRRGRRGRGGEEREGRKRTMSKKTNTKQVRVCG